MKNPLYDYILENHKNDDRYKFAKTKRGAKYCLISTGYNQNGSESHFSIFHDIITEKSSFSYNSDCHFTHRDKIYLDDNHYAYEAVHIYFLTDGSAKEYIEKDSPGKRKAIPRQDIPKWHALAKTAYEEFISPLKQAIAKKAEAAAEEEKKRLELDNCKKELSDFSIQSFWSITSDNGFEQQYTTETQYLQARINDLRLKGSEDKDSEQELSKINTMITAQPFRDRSSTPLDWEDRCDEEGNTPSI